MKLNLITKFFLLLFLSILIFNASIYIFNIINPWLGIILSVFWVFLMSYLIIKILKKS